MRPLPRPGAKRPRMPNPGNLSAAGAVKGGMRTLTFIPLVLAALSMVACGGGDESSSAGSAPASATGPGLSIAEAKASTHKGPLLVNGGLVAKGDTVRLCSALAESYPPQCAGESLVVEGLDLSSIESLQREGDAAWTNGQIQLLGTVRDGVLQVSQNATA